MRAKLWAVFLLAAFAVAASDLLAAHGGGGGKAGGGGGGKGGGGNKGGGGKGKALAGENDDENDQMLWRNNLKDALTAVAERNEAVMAVVARTDNENDKKAVQQLGNWPQLVALSHGPVAAVELNETEGKDLMTKLNLKSYPGIVWLDRNANVLVGQSMPDIVTPVLDVASKWKTTVASIEKYFKDHNLRADKLLDRGRLREAYIEYAYVAPFKGPEPEKAQAGQTKIKEKWMKLIEMARGLPEDSSGRAAVVKGVRREVIALDCAAAMEEELKKIPAKQVVAAKTPETPDKPAAEKTAPPDSPTETAAATKAPPAMPAIENKSLAQLAASAPASAAAVEAEDTGVDMRPLQKATDERLKKAEKLTQEGLVAYRKATADTMDRGQARNDLLADAHVKLELALTLIDQGTESKPDAQMSKLMERVSMLIYGCLKYRTL